jgi:thiamine pyrophosphokinase
MTETLIITGGRIEHDFALDFLNKKQKDFTHIIGVDGGLKFCYEQDIVPTRIVGDFDTLDPAILKWYQEQTDIEIRKFNPVKDATDTQIAVELALELGSGSITILGGTGTRLDHVLGNIQTLYLPFEKKVPCQIVDAHNRIRLIEGRQMLKKEEQYGNYFSLIPLTTRVEGVTLRGVKYPLENRDFTVLGTGSLGVSNEIMEAQAEITIESGIFILIESRD